MVRNRFKLSSNVNISTLVLERLFVLFVGKFAKRNASFIIFFYWHEALRAEERKPLVKTVGILTFMPSAFDRRF